jgi:hypothetical protein
VTSLDLVLVDADGREAWRGALPPHVSERLIADTHMHGVLADALPNDAAPVRVDRFALETDAEEKHLRIIVGAGDSSYEKSYLPARAIRDDVEVVLARLLADKRVEPGTYGFRCEPSPAEETASLRMAPLPRRLPRLARRSIFQLGMVAPPRCRHPTLLLPRRPAARLVAQARAAPDVEVGAVLVVEPCLVIEPVPCRLAVRVLDAVPLAHGTTGTATRLRITPEALAAVPTDEEHGRHRGGLAHSHPFGDMAEPHVLSTDDKAFTTSFFYRPFGLQIVVDPRFTAPEDALAAFCWIDGALARVCCTFIEEEETTCPPSVPPK